MKSPFFTTGAMEEEKWGPKVKGKGDKHGIIAWTRDKRTIDSSYGASGKCYVFPESSS